MRCLEWRKGRREHLALRIITVVVVIRYNLLLACQTLTGLPHAGQCGTDWDPRTDREADEAAVNIWLCPAVNKVASEEPGVEGRAIQGGFSEEVSLS